MGFFDRLNEGLERSRTKFKEQMNVLLQRGPNLDDDFWDSLEEALILADVGGAVASRVVENLKDRATRMALPNAQAVLSLLKDQMADFFVPDEKEIFGGAPAVVLFVGVNGSGKTPRWESWQSRQRKKEEKCCWEAPIRFVRRQLSSWKCGRSVQTCPFVCVNGEVTRQVFATTRLSRHNAKAPTWF